MNFQYEWDDTFEADLLKLRASVANAFTEVSLDNSLPQQSVHCSTIYYYYSNITGIVLNWIFDFGKPVIV
ncbi:MAG: hypothetical protein V7K15_17745 [Nostoc sp.]